MNARSSSFPALVVKAGVVMVLPDNTTPELAEVVRSMASPAAVKSTPVTLTPLTVTAADAGVNVKPVLAGVTV